MVWGGFSARDLTNLVLPLGRVNSAMYLKMMQRQLLPYMEQFSSVYFMFMQDSASFHTAKDTKKFLKSKNIRLMKWLSRSPDLNPMENVWGMMVREVYAEHKQYNNVSELKEAILKAWNNIDVPYLQTLIRSMPNPCCEVLAAQGNSINY